MELKTINDLISEIKNLKLAKELLERIFYELGPYRDGKIIDNTWMEVKDYFDFDDSE
jgi:hypothetical protein